jgi:hypothetical protein
MDAAPFDRVAAHAQKWQQIGATPPLIRMIKYGARLPWTGQPRRGVRREYPLPPEDYRFAFNEVNRRVAQGFAEEITEAEARRIGPVVSGFVVHGSKPRDVIGYATKDKALTTPNSGWLPQLGSTHLPVAHVVKDWPRYPPGICGAQAPRFVLCSR